jgi:aminopeptidase N
VAIADYGRADLGELSYTKGPWVLAVLDDTVGHDKFLETVRVFLNRYRKSGAKRPDFKAVAEETCGRRIDALWSDWVEKGEPSTALLRQYSEPARIADRYR